METVIKIRYLYLFVAFINFLTCVQKTVAFGPCFLQGNCDIGKILGDVGGALNAPISIQLGNNKNARNDQNDQGEAPVIVSGNWIESASLKTDQIYLFAQDAPSMTWYDAEKYCEDKGAFLAEPYDEAEQNFLRDQANRLQNTNWWLGLREFEKCECVALGRSSSKVEAFVDRNSLLQPINNGLGLTTCPSQFEKRCSGNEWRWGFSGQIPTYTYWNSKTGEPNGNTEHCITMWFKSDNQRWGDWDCKTTVDSPNENSGFKPVCQKTKNTDGNIKDPGGDDYDCDDDYGCDEEEEGDQNANLEESVAKCVAVDTAYKFGKKKITKIDGVISYQQCQLKCAEESECNYWKFKQNGKCVLSRGVKNKNFVKNRPGTTSGTILNGCKPNTNIEEQTTVSNTDNSDNSKKDYCVEYGATYNGGNQISVLNNVDNAELCREECLKSGS